jgi:starch synthase
MNAKTGLQPRRHALRNACRSLGSRAAGNDPIYQVVHLSAECWPFARTGGLGEAVRGLASAQAAAGGHAAVVIPLYRAVRERTPSLQLVRPPITINVGGRAERVRLYRVPSADAAPETFFISHPVFDRAGFYGEAGADYGDNAFRFALFSIAALTCLPLIAPRTRVLHAHDWHTALALVYLRTVFATEPWHGRLATVLSVHNAGFQGHVPAHTMAELGLPAALFDWRWMEWYGRLNLLKGGLAFCDMAVTVSPTHAAELRTPDGGFGLHETFAHLGDRFVGILNGIDTGGWNPEDDSDITAGYSADDLSGKHACKVALQRAYGLPDRPDVPVFGMSARLVAQKGLDLVLAANLPACDAQFVFLGTGEAQYEGALRTLAATASDRVAMDVGFTDRREHELLAGADALLMPSLYEPCGLTQMRAQRYGTLPVARRVGGLVDTVRHTETGFLFDDYTPAALQRIVQEVTRRYADRHAWGNAVRHAMGQQFGWDERAAEYLGVYRRALASRSTV